MTCQEARDLMLVCVTGTTPPDERRALAAHLQTCADCRIEAAALEETMALLRAAPEPRLPDGHWASFMAALDRRLQQDLHHPWRWLLRRIRNPRTAWSTAAATSALVLALGIALLVHPVNRTGSLPPTAPIGLQGLVTDSIVQAMPSMAASLDIWKAGLSAAEVPYEFVSAGGE